MSRVDDRPESPSSAAPASPAAAERPDVSRGQTLELEVDGLAFGGRALARVDGLVVFVENALPGDRVSARVFRRRKQYAEAHAERVLRPSPARVEPRCAHTAICGGCRYQDLDYAEQLRHKRSQVEECLAHLGGIRVESRPVIPAPKLFHYRNKMEYSFG